MTDIKFFVAGEPAPKGSTKSFPYRRNNGHLGVSTTNANPKTAPWEARVSCEAQRAFLDAEQRMFDGAVEVRMTFHLPRPASLPKRVTWPIKRKFDVDKLARAILDGLTGVAFVDDGQVVRIMATKRYGAEYIGCAIEVSEVLG